MPAACIGFAGLEVGRPATVSVSSGDLRSATLSVEFDLYGVFVGDAGFHQTSSKIWRHDLSLSASSAAAAMSSDSAAPEIAVADVVSQVCTEGSVQPGQGVILGVVRDAVTRLPIAGAEVTVSWPSTSERVAQLIQNYSIEDIVAVLPADSAGFYAACGVPASTVITLHAAAGDRLSDFVRLQFTGEGVVSGETLHLSDDALWLQEFHLVPPSQRNASLSGTVSRATDSTGVPGAVVQIANTALETTTDANGRFSMRDLPTGPVKLQVRFVSLMPRDQEVTLIEDRTVALQPDALRLQPIPTELEPVIVEAEAPTTRRPLAEFFKRRENGSGSYLTREEWERAGPPRVPTQVLRRMRGIRLLPNPRYGSGGPRWFVVTSRARSRILELGPCPPLYFLDGSYIGDAMQTDIDTAMPMVDLEAIEVYATIAGLPPEFNRPGAACGVIVFWTR